MSDVRFAVAGETHVAYREIGGPGEVDIVMVSGSFFPLEKLEQDRVAARFIEGLASIGRVVIFDKRGVGLSDPMTDWTISAQEQWADDLCAVVEASSLSRPVIVSWELMGVARHAAAARPALFGSMVLINPVQSTRGMVEMVKESSDSSIPSPSIEQRAFPSRIEDPDFREWLAQAGRTGASPAAAGRMWRHVLGYEQRLTPSGIELPTLVLYNEDSMTSEGNVTTVADAIPGATLVRVAGADNYPVSGDVDTIVVEIARFITGESNQLAPERALSAVLFTDLVDSTSLASTVGDAQWRNLLDYHDGAVERHVERSGGRVVKYMGDGVLALVPSASAALEATRRITADLAKRGLAIRAGVHVGEVDVRGDDVSGIAVNAAARIMGQADGGQTLVSESARQSMLGSGLVFDSVGTGELKGIAEPFSLFRWRHELE